MAICIICGHSNKNAPKYSEWTCEKCEQEYDYDEGHMILLSGWQIEILREAKGLKHEPDTEGSNE